MERPAWFRKLLGHSPATARLDEDQCVYAVGDIHGRADLLTELLDKIWADAGDKKNTLVFLGDYVDRGPSSKGVVELVSNLTRPGWEIVCLRGNHEESLLEFLRNPDIYQAWRAFGGGETLWSYGVKPPTFSDRKEVTRAQQEFAEKLPPSHFAFLSNLAFSHTIGGYHFVHAGVRPGLALERQVPEDQLWIREDFLLHEGTFEKIIVHGHSPSEAPVVRRNRIGVDTGAYATNCLTAAKLTGETYSFLSTGNPQP